MTNSLPEIVNPTITDYLFKPWVFTGILVVIVLLILWKVGVLARAKTFSFKFLKIADLQVQTHQAQPATSSDEPKPEPAKPTKNRAAQKRQAKKLTNVAGLQAQLGSVLAEQKKAQKPLPPNFEARQIEKGFEKLKTGQIADIIEAKKCFDSVLQRNPKSVDANYGLASVLERWKDIPNAIKYYWEATRAGDRNHPQAIKAQARLDDLSKLERQQNMAQAAIKAGPNGNSFWFDQVPDGKNLARHLVALSNSEDGGFMLVGLDRATRKYAGNGLEEWEQMLDAARQHYVTAPCILEIFHSRQPRCIFVIVQRGLNRPYRVNDDKEAKVYVPDGSGEVREATTDEIEELRKKKRG